MDGMKMVTAVRAVRHTSTNRTLLLASEPFQLEGYNLVQVQFVDDTGKIKTEELPIDELIPEDF